MGSSKTLNRCTLDSRGRITIPAGVRKALGLKPGEPVVIETDDGGFRLRSLAQTLREVQEAFAPYRIPGISVVDELIAERRAEAAAEEEATGDRVAPRTSSTRDAVHRYTREVKGIP